MPETAAPVEQLPTAGGSYLRQPDGTLQRLPDEPPAPVPAPAAAATPKTPQE